MLSGRPTRPGARSRTSALSARRELLALIRQIADSGTVVGTTGNASVRCEPGFLVTPTRFPYDRLRRRHLVRVDAGGRPLRGDQRPSRDTLMHAAIYRDRPDAGAIVHHHGPHCTAWGFLGTELSPRLEEDAYLSIGPVRTVREDQVADSEWGSVFADTTAVILRGHGLIALGEDASEAWARAQAVEHEARVAGIVRLHGGIAAPGAAG